jgi:hypothetical protein
VWQQQLLQRLLGVWGMLVCLQQLKSCGAVSGEQQDEVFMVTAMVHDQQVVCLAAVTASIPTTAAMLQPCFAVSAVPAALQMADARRNAVIVAVSHPPTHPPAHLLAHLSSHPPSPQLLLEADAKVQGFKAELVQKQDMHLATLHKDLERQQNYLDKMKAEVR